MRGREGINGVTEWEKTMMARVLGWLKRRVCCVGRASIGPCESESESDSESSGQDK